MLNKNHVWYVFLFFSLITFINVKATDQKENELNQVNMLADEFVKILFDFYPQYATYSGINNNYLDKLPDHSLNAYQELHDQLDLLLLKIQKINIQLIKDKPEYISYVMLRNFLERLILEKQCRFELWNISPTYNGWQSDFSSLASIQPVETEDQRVKALKRFSSIDDYINTEIINLKEGLKKGYTASKYIVQSVIDQMNEMINAPVSESPFMQMAREDQPDFNNKLKSIIEQEINPAFVTYRDFLLNDYLPHARNSISVNANKNCSQCYKATLRSNTDLNIEPEKLYETGKKQISKIHDEMRLIGKKIFNTDNISKIFEKSKTDPNLLFSTRKEIITYAENAIERVHKVIPDWFGQYPHSHVKVIPFPTTQELTAPPGMYFPPSDDGTREGIFFVNTYQPEKQTKTDFESTVFHETYPGHHLQVTIASERKDLHAISHYFFSTAFAEGWALYSERLADEMNLYSSDIDRLGQLSNEVFRAARLVVDTGIHEFNWSRQQAIDYLLANTSINKNFAKSEVDRYIAVPGQATSYMVGYLMFSKLREKAEKELGDKFNIKIFHDTLLEDGAIPLWLLEDKMNNWIINVKNKAL